MPDDIVGWSIESYRTARGTSPVEDFLDSLPAEQQGKVDFCLNLLEESGTQLGMPYARPVKDHKPLWELRPLPNRIFYCAYKGRRFILLHAFKKGKWKTDKRHIQTAENRWREFLEREK